MQLRQLRAIQLNSIAQRPVLIVLVGLIIAAWLSLFALEQSPLGHSMGHAGHASVAGPAGTQESGVLALAFFAGGWALMVVAMMLPTVLPLVGRFSGAIAGPGARARSIFLLLGGYVLVWTAFGIGAHLALQALLQAFGLALEASGLIGPMALVLAGIYQFMPLKRLSIHSVCSPPSLAPVEDERRWRRWPLLLGVREGIACVGCCWAMMLLMLVGVAGSIGGMLVLGMVMWAEKNASWGRRLVVPLGVFLIGLGLMLGGEALLGIPWYFYSV